MTLKTFFFKGVLQQSLKKALIQFRVLLYHNSARIRSFAARLTGEGIGHDRVGQVGSKEKYNVVSSASLKGHFKSRCHLT